MVIVFGQAGIFRPGPKNSLQFALANFANGGRKLQFVARFLTGIGQEF
jgi:hypothetical protein